MYAFIYVLGCSYHAIYVCTQKQIMYITQKAIR